MPSITVKKDCVYIIIDKDSLYCIKKECILGYWVRGTFTTYLTIYTNLPKADICIDYTGKEANEQCEKHIDILNKIISPEVPEVVQPSVNMLKN
jgi:hypothetical protein